MSRGNYASSWYNIYILTYVTSSSGGYKDESENWELYQ